MVHRVPIVRSGFIIGATDGITQQVAVGIFLVREHRRLSKVGFLQSDGGTVRSEENSFMLDFEKSLIGMQCVWFLFLLKRNRVYEKEEYILNLSLIPFMYNNI